MPSNTVARYGKSLPFVLAYVKKGWPVVPAAYPATPQSVEPFMQPVTPPGSLPVFDEDLAIAIWATANDLGVALCTGPTTPGFAHAVDGSSRARRCREALGRPPDIESASGTQMWIVNPGEIKLLDDDLLVPTGTLVPLPPTRDAGGGTLRWRDDTAAMSDTPSRK